MQPLFERESARARRKKLLFAHSNECSAQLCVLTRICMPLTGAHSTSNAHLIFHSARLFVSLRWTLPPHSVHIERLEKSKTTANESQTRARFSSNTPPVLSVQFAPRIFIILLLSLQRSHSVYHARCIWNLAYFSPKYTQCGRIRFKWKYSVFACEISHLA